MPKSSCDGWVRILDVLLGRLHIFLMSLLMILSSFLMYGFEKMTV